MTVGGTIAPGLEGVREAFAANFTERAEVGAAVCVYVEGRPVVDLWGGFADPDEGRPWTERTVVPFFSATKGMTAVCVSMLVERGLLDPDAPVAELWPEFAAAGKGAITVGDVCAHRAGLPYVEGEWSLADVLAWEPMVAALATQAPIWPPGTKHGYHMRTYGWLVGEIVRRADPAGRRPGAFLCDEIAAPLGLDLWIGLPEVEEPRVARLVPPRDSLRDALAAFGDDLLLARVFSNPGGHFDYDDMWNTRELHAAELPSSSGIGDARSLARMYAACAGEVDGVRLLDDATVAAAAVTRSSGRDEVLMAPNRFGLGFMLGASFGAANPPTAVGHAGAGGALAFVDPERRIAFAYVMSDLRFDPSGDPRSEELVRAVYAAL